MSSSAALARNPAGLNPSMCEGKMAYRSAQLAWSMVKRRRDRGKDKRAGQLRKMPDRVYRCPFCRLWHVGRSAIS